MAFGRDLRAATCSTGSAPSRQREVQQFGAPSLITRTTNDVQQVQMLVLMACTIACRRADHDGRRRDHGAARGRRPVVAAGRRRARRCSSCVGLVVSRMVPDFRLMQERIDEVNRVLREQITGIRVVRAFVREPHETAALRQGQRRPHRRRRRAPAGGWR